MEVPCFRRQAPEWTGQQGEQVAATEFVSDKQYRVWIADHQDGFVLNAQAGEKNSDVILHRANCRAAVTEKAKVGALTSISYRKIGAASVVELEAWIQAERPSVWAKPDGEKYRVCKLCTPLASVAPRGRRCWWVNHKGSQQAEVGGGYVWSPKTDRTGAYNKAYENLSLARRGDIVFSYAALKIRAWGIVSAAARTAGRPVGHGEGWAQEGWRLPISWQALEEPLVVKEHLDAIVHLLPDKYSPIQHNGNGNQKFYLSEISEELAAVLLQRAAIVDPAGMDSDEALGEATADVEEERIRRSPSMSPTQKKRLINARNGQGLFKARVGQIETRCRLTGVSGNDLLIASHIKAWSISDDEEKLDGSNGLLLAPHVDRLFDRGWISFENDGTVLVASKRIRAVMLAWGLDPEKNVGPFTVQQGDYLEHHRNGPFALRRQH